MSAAFRALTEPATFAGHDCAKRMPFSMRMATAPGIMIIGTGVLASVSLFVPAHIVSAHFLLNLVLLISLILIGLTGLGGLVGLTVGLELNTTQGD